MRIALMGPTASGKSALAVLVAQRVHGAVVNGDVYQAFRDIPIGTGQPTAAERSGVPHHLYGLLPLSERPNPDTFGMLVRHELELLETAVLVTGSGLYLRGIWQQLSQLPEVPANIVEKVRHWARAVPLPILHRYLAAVDPRRAGELHPNDGSRIQRALALHLVTGGRPSDLLTGVTKGLPEGWRALLVLPSRERLRQRVDARVRAMVDAGWRDEVQHLSGQWEDLRALRPLGYTHWMACQDVQETQQRIIADTQAYAKRQTTYFRNQWPEIPIWDPDSESVDQAFERLDL